MSTANDLSRMVPGFEFLQNLMKGASAGLPGVQGFGQWVAPTLDPAELDKRIQELKTVQFWLEQNARLLGTTVQALEVQRMTLATLQTMNLPMADLATALRARVASPPAPPAPAATQTWARPAPAAASPPPAADEGDDEHPQPAASASDAEPPATAAKAAAIDPMQWWGALTQQFTEIAARAVKDRSAAAAAAPAAAGPGKPERRAAAVKPAAPADSNAGRAAGKAGAGTRRQAAPRKRPG